MIRSIYTGASGVRNHQTKMDVIGNNIANVNTVGYKSSRATFADMLSQSVKGATGTNGNIGGTNPLQVGLGLKVSSIDLMFQNGAPRVTGKNTDLCLSGDGLFVVKGGADTYYTRDGAFEFDGEGNYVLPNSGHYVQGWMASDGVITPGGATENINVKKGTIMEAKATDAVDFLDNLDASTPTVTGISGGEEIVTTTILAEDVTESDPLPVTFGGKEFTVVGLSGNLNKIKTWSAKEDIPLGATTADFVNEDGVTVTAKLYPAAKFEVPKGSVLGMPLNYITKGSVTEEYPLSVGIDDKQYTVIGIDKNIDFTKSWTVKSGGASAGDSSIVITNGSEDCTLKLDKPLEESIGQGSQIIVESTGIRSSTTNPVTITLSDGTTVVQTEGTYKVGNSMPIASTVSVYDSLGNTHNVPVYFIHEGNLSDGTSPSRWLVSLTPDATVTKGDATTATYTDADGNTMTANLNVAEIQFDSSGQLVTTSDSDTTGTLLLSYTGTGEDVPSEQSVAVDFTALTQLAGSNTIRSTKNGYVEGMLKEVQIDSSGIITGLYTNGQRRNEAQVAVAHFANSPGLIKDGTSLYKQTDNSGTPELNTAEHFGAVITPGALEMSNTDVANEFAEMIITQRGFQSNAKIITVGDEMVQTAVNMKR